MITSGGTLLKHGLAARMCPSPLCTADRAAQSTKHFQLARIVLRPVKLLVSATQPAVMLEIEA